LRTCRGEQKVKKTFRDENRKEGESIDRMRKSKPERKNRIDCINREGGINDDYGGMETHWLDWRTSPLSGNI
jgi:hypothetical protein